MSQENRGLASAVKGALSGKKRVSRGLVSLSSAVILAVYAVGYEQTKSAADQFAAQSEERRIINPAAAIATLPLAPTAPIGSGAAGAAPTPAPAVDEPQIASLPAAPTAPIGSGAAGDTPVPAPAAEKRQIASLPAAAAAIGSGAAGAAPVPAPAAEKRQIAALPAAAPAAIGSGATGAAPAPARPKPTAEPAATPAAPEPEAAAAAAPAAPVAQQSELKDGSYFGWGTSRHGNIEANVVIQNGRIASAVISQCRTRYPCSWISHLPGQVVERQSPEVDYVSGATQSVNAYYYAVVEALSQAK